MPLPQWLTHHYEPRPGEPRLVFDEKSGESAAIVIGCVVLYGAICFVVWAIDTFKNGWPW